MGDLSEISDMFAHAATGFAVTEPGGRVVKANKAMRQIVDLTDQEMQDVNLFDLTHPGDQAQHRSMLEKLLAYEIPAFVIEKRYVRPDGEPVWVRNSVTVINKDQSPGPHLIHTCENLSDRKRAESILARQEQMAAIGRLTSSIVHEINNPLEAIFNLMYLAQHSTDLQDAKLHLRQAQEELERISEITSQSLQFHRQPSSATSANVVGLLETVLTLFKARFNATGVKVTFTSEDSPELMCFAGEVRQIFVNLLDNAVEAMHGGGDLTLRVRPATDWRTGEPGVRVTIADTGSGMSLETRRRMYEAFFTTKGDHGSGLGLWVTASIVRKHNGHMHVRSKCIDGSGTVFSLVFPYRGADGKVSGFQDAA
jgi:PAS domain S-box-containing protein